MPGSKWLVCSLTTRGPSFGWNRQIKLTSAFGPPASSHGKKKLYDGPTDDLLWRRAI